MFKRNRSLGHYQAYYFYRLGNKDPIAWMASTLIGVMKSCKWNSFFNFDDFNDSFYKAFREYELTILRDKNSSKKQKTDSRKRLIMLRMFRKELNIR